MAPVGRLSLMRNYCHALLSCKPLDVKKCQEGNQKQNSETHTHTILCPSSDTPCARKGRAVLRRFGKEKLAKSTWLRGACDPSVDHNPCKRWLREGKPRIWAFGLDKVSFRSHIIGMEYEGTRLRKTVWWAGETKMRPTHLGICVV